MAATVKATRPDVQVVVEQVSDDRSRRADVMLTFPDGQQVAVEVQFSQLSVPEWQERHDSYKTQGITDVWLRFLTRPTNPTDDSTQFPDALSSAALAAGVQMLWLDLDQEFIAIPHKDRRAPLAKESHDLWWGKLATAPWGPGGIHEDAWQRAVVRRAEHVAKLEAEEQEWRRRLARQVVPKAVPAAVPRNAAGGWREQKPLSEG